MGAFESTRGTASRKIGWPLLGHAALLVAVPCLAVSALQAQVSFTERAEFGTGLTIPVAWADFDGDGDADLALGNFGNQANELYVNQGDGTFLGGSEFGTGSTFAVVWGDFDNDGDRDLAVGNGTPGQNFLHVNNGDGTFESQIQFGPFRTVGLAWADANLDGYLDLAVGNGILGVPEQNLLYTNLGNGSFQGGIQFGMQQTDSVAWGDADGDGDPDLAVGNGGFNTVAQNFLYVNNGNGSYTQQAQFGTGNTSALAWGDVDDDGDLDLAVMNWNGGQSMLYRNNGVGGFTGESQFGIGDPNTLAFGDFDNDGDLDLAQGNGDFQSAAQNILWINDGSGSFSAQSHFGVGSTDSVAWADVEGDGDLDLAVGNEHSPTQNNLYLNESAVGGFVRLLPRGRFHEQGAGYSNRDGVGAEIRFYEAGFVGDAAHLLGLRQVEAAGGFTTQNERTIHFGLGTLPAVDARIRWPGSEGSRIVQDVVGIRRRSRLVVPESAVPTGPGDVSSLTLERAAGPGELTLSWGVSCTGGENDFGIHEGTLGDWSSHAAIDCSDDGISGEETISPAAGDRYYLVVPLDDDVEGSYGIDSAGIERPAGSSACRAAQTLARCP